jgi:hypothetical protein
MSEIAKNPAPATNEQILSMLESQDYAGVSEQLLTQIHSTKTTSAWQEAALGTSQHHLGEVGGAIVHLQNAVLLDRFNSAYRNNLILAREKVDGGLGASLNHPADWGFELSTWIRPKESASLAFLVLNIFLLLRFFKKPQAKRDLVLGVVLLVLIAVSGLGFYGENLGVVTEAAGLKRRPVASAQETRTLPPGTRVRKIRDSGEFSEIESSNSIRGWVNKNSLKMFF